MFIGAKSQTELRSSRKNNSTDAMIENIMEIRKFNEPDRNTLIELWKTIFPNSPPHNEPSRVINEKLAVDDLIFVVENEGQLIGACMAGYDGHRGWPYAVGVLEEHRCEGIGAALVRHVLKALKAIGCVKVNLQIRATNSGVAVFYKSLGFKTEDRLSMGTLII